mgnify:CR=1 FL=1
MKKFFLLTAIVEILAGLVLFFAADKIPDLINANPLTIGFAKMYGVAAFSLGLYALFSWKFFDFKKLHIPFLIIFSIFNIGIAFAVIQSSLNFGFENPGPGYFHLILGLIALYFLFKKKSLNNNFSKNFFYFFLLIFTALITTNYTLFTLPIFFTTESLVRVLILFTIFVFSGLYYLNKIANKNFNSKPKRILFITLTGSILAWIIQLIEIHLYHYEINVDSPIGLFEDEFIRTFIYVLPTLLITELIWEYLKNKQRVFYAGITVIFIYSYASFYTSFIFSDANPAKYSDLIKQNTELPNVILIVADDLGYKDISANGNKLIETSHIDQIGQNGINFSRAYAAASVCAPSRAAFLTGNYHHRYGFEFLPDLFNYSPRVRKADFKRFGHQDNFKMWYEKDVPINQRGLDPYVNTIGDDLRKGIVPLPTKQPSTVLFQLLGMMISSGQQLSSVTDLMTGENPYSRFHDQRVVPAIRGGAEFTRDVVIPSIGAVEQNYLRPAAQFAIDKGWEADAAAKNWARNDPRLAAGMGRHDAAIASLQKNVGAAFSGIHFDHAQLDQAGDDQTRTAPNAVIHSGGDIQGVEPGLGAHVESEPAFTWKRKTYGQPMVERLNRWEEIRREREQGDSY